MQGTFSTAQLCCSPHGLLRLPVGLLDTALYSALFHGFCRQFSPASSCVRPGWLPSHRLSPLVALQRQWYETDSEYYLLQFTLTVRCLFYTSFSLELCRQPAPAPAQPAASSFPWLLAYVFYYPVFHNGPILNFPEFYKQVESSGGLDGFCVGLSLLPRL